MIWYCLNMFFLFYLDNATMVSDGEVLGLGTNSIKLNSYRMDYGTIVAYIGVTAENCIPAMETIRGDINGSKYLTDHLNLKD